MPTADIWYLQWDSNEQAQRSFLGFNTGTKSEVTAEEFAEQYERVGAQSDISDPEDVFVRWVRGSGRESESFLDENVRSMSPGDIVAIDDTIYLCLGVGWEEQPQLDDHLLG